MSARIANFAKLGSLLNKSTRRPKEAMGGKRPRERDDSHLRLIRQLPCLCCGVERGIEAAHISMTYAALGKRGRGIGMKADDRWCVPLAWDCHSKQHRIGEEAFWEAIGINPILVASALWAVSPDLDAMRAAVLKFRQDALRDEGRR